MDALSVNSHCDIQPVVDDQGNAVALTQPVYLSDERKVFAGGFFLFPNLQKVTPP